MSTPFSWIMDTKTRNSRLKKYSVQVSSGVSTVCATLALTPLDNVKTRMQTHNFQSVSECMRYIWRTEGPRGYVAGALPPLASVTVVRVLSFTAYSWAKEKISNGTAMINGTGALNVQDAQESRKLFPSISQLCTYTAAGAFAGIVTAPLACPFELAKNVVQTSVLVANRAQAAPGAAQDASLRRKPRVGTIEAIRKIIKIHGVRGLYTGFHLHVMRDAVGTGLYFSIYESVKEMASKELGEKTSPVGAPAIAGAVCSTLPWFCTYPLDTRKTRAQSVLLGKSKEVGEASVAVAKSSMYKGLSIILLRTGINNMILMCIMEYLKGKIESLP
ncbi:hypothetical protein N7540_005204 [Penicillium herquei]|nr:hypothetical protein N7540_005204 [Penicillium herquei]